MAGWEIHFVSSACLLLRTVYPKHVYLDSFFDEIAERVNTP